MKNSRILTAAVCAALFAPGSLARANSESLNIHETPDLVTAAPPLGVQPTVRFKRIVSTARPGPRGELDGAPAESVETLGAYLHRRVVGMLEDRTVVVMRLSQPISDSQATGVLHQRAFLEAPFLAYYDSTGALSDVEFAEYVPPHSREALYDLLLALQDVTPSTRLSSFDTTLRRPGRELDVRYTTEHASDGTIRLHRELVARRKTDNRPGHRVAYEIHSSKGWVDARLDGSGIASLLYEDVVDVFYKGGLAAREQTSVRAEVEDAPSVVELPSDMGDAFEAVHGNDAKRLRFYVMSQDEVSAVKDLSFGDAMRAFLDKVDETPSDATFVLKNFVRLYPEASPHVAAYLNGLGQTTENRKRVGFAYSALAAAGHTEAQRVIADVLTASTFNAMNKDRAARGTLSIMQPERFLAPALWAYRQSLPTDGLKAREDRQIMGNLYGALGGFEHGEPEVTREVVSKLLAEYKAEPDVVRASALLPALGNTGDFERLWPEFAPLFDHPQTVVRRRAYYIFQKAMGEAAFALFAERYARETEATVLLEAGAIAAAMPRSAARLVWARETMPRTNDSVTLGRLVRIVGDQLNDSPKNVRALRELLNSRIDDEVRRMVYRYISPVVAKGGVQ